jgi:hypothetical protein|tara:strand:+ start:9428 stop:10009 length:582 start_codon:yes stop_codon:yes gene_type:complete
MEIKEYLQSIHGFRLMKMIIYLSIIPTVIIFGYLLKIDYDNNKNSLKKKPKKKYIGILIAVALIFFLLNFSILCTRLFNQKLTGEFNVFTLILVFLSSILVFCSVYYIIHEYDNDAFMISGSVEKDDPLYNTKTYLTYLYYSIYTLFTQGYGDIYPKKVYSRLIACLQMLISYILTAYVFSKIIANSEQVSSN